jgi:hypothetical protein
MHFGLLHSNSVVTNLITIEAVVDASLNPETDLAQAKNMIGLHTLKQIYPFLCDSPALQEHFDMVWGHKINYRQKDMLDIRTCANTYRHSTEKLLFVRF